MMLRVESQSRDVMMEFAFMAVSRLLLDQNLLPKLYISLSSLQYLFFPLSTYFRLTFERVNSTFDLRLLQSDYLGTSSFFEGQGRVGLSQALSFQRLASSLGSQIIKGKNGLQLTTTSFYGQTSSSSTSSLLFSMISSSMSSSRSMILSLVSLTSFTVLITCLVLAQLFLSSGLPCCWGEGMSILYLVSGRQFYQMEGSITVCDFLYWEACDCSSSWQLQTGMLLVGMISRGVDASSERYSSISLNSFIPIILATIIIDEIKHILIDLFHQDILHNHRSIVGKIKLYANHFAIAGLQSTINFNSKAQIKQLMSHSRVRALDKPFILQSITINHRPESHHSSEEPSFLKLSEPNSAELTPLTPSSLFLDMQNRLNTLQAKSMRRISQIRQQMQSYNYAGKPLSNCSPYTQNKQLAQVMCRKLQHPYAYEEQLQQFNFQMDENLNYICDRQNQAISNLCIELIDRNRLVSEEGANFKQVIIDSTRSSNKLKEVYYSRRQATLTRKKSERNRKTSNSTLKQNNTAPVRLYEQILSNYSTSKLLAMHKTTK